MNETGQFAEDVGQDIAAGRINRWAELYALDAVSDAERDMIDEYISTASNEIRLGFLEQVRQARETAAAVYATHEAEPPAGLRSRILNQVSAGPAGAAGSGAAGPAPTSSGPGPDEADDGGDELARRRHRKETRPSTLRRWVIGAAAAAAVAIGSVTVAQNLDDPSLREQVVQASDVRSATVEFPVGGVAQIKRSENLNAAVVTLRDVPAPQPGKVYQMWRLPEDGSAPESVGTMSGEESSTTTVVEGIDPYSALAITVEPEGGSKTPTMPIVAQIPLQT
ncbi:anti-sigma factor [Arthrobacter castelli]|uniref:anti-sigma factor n=1 Tax=Arthrobacter castelli TaxID=271431 RepID=UPI000412BF14|nr:anti-sigma factor [Arthrobacter castelli]